MKKQLFMLIFILGVHTIYTSEYIEYENNNNEVTISPLDLLDYFSPYYQIASDKNTNNYEQITNIFTKCGRQKGSENTFVVTRFDKELLKSIFIESNLDRKNIRKINRAINTVSKLQLITITGDFHPDLFDKNIRDEKKLNLIRKFEKEYYKKNKKSIVFFKGTRDWVEQYNNAFNGTGMFFVQYQMSYFPEKFVLRDYLDVLDGTMLQLRDRLGRNILMHACLNGDFDLIKTIIKLIKENNIEIEKFIDIHDNESKTALIHAVIKNNKKAVTKMIKENANVNAQDFEGKTALHHAAINYNEFDSVDTDQKQILTFHYEIIKDLISNGGADVTIKDNDGKTLLHHLVYAGNEDAIEYLIDKCNIDIDATDKDGNTALLISAKSNYNKNIIKKLLKSGADSGIQNEFGKNALMYILKFKNKKIEKILQENKSISEENINKSGHDNRNTLLNVLSTDYKGSDNILKLVIEKTSEINQPDETGKTALHYAALHGNYYAMKLILEKNPEINTQDENGKTALHWAALKGHNKIITLLLDNGANYDILDNKNKSYEDYLNNFKTQNKKNKKSKK